jgi:hypothetical protein
MAINKKLYTIHETLHCHTPLKKEDGSNVIVHSPHLGYSAYRCSCGTVIDLVSGDSGYNETETSFGVKYSDCLYRRLPKAYRQFQRKTGTRELRK